MKPILSAIAIAGIFSMTACSNSASKQSEAGNQHTIDSLNMELTKKKVVDSMNEAARMQSYPMPVVAPVTPGVNPVTPVAHASHTTHTHHSAGTAASSGGAGTVAQASQPVYEQPAPVEPPRKKGWSAKAKGALIGAGAGAIGGAVIDHNNRGAGAVIGGILGAGAGTGAGAIIDKKKGR